MTTDAGRRESGAMLAADVRRTVARANAYHVLAQAFAEPAEWDAALPDALAAAFAPLGSPLDALAREASKAMAEALHDREPLAVAHARLFLGPFRIDAPPYASLYLDPEGRLMGPVSQEAARAYAEAGLGPSDARREPPDHVRLELEFMYFLAFQQAKTGDPVWAERQRSFWQTHLGLWLPALAERMSAADSHAFYSRLARLLGVFTECEDRPGLSH